MTLPLTQRLNSLGLLETLEPTPVVGEEEHPTQNTANSRKAIADRLHPHWRDFLATWTSADLRQATASANDAQRQEIAQAWADCLEEEFKAVLVELKGPDLKGVLLPWVEACLNRRHTDLPLPPQAFLEEWVAVLDPASPGDHLAFWHQMSKQLREADSEQDRKIATKAVEVLAPKLLEVLKSHIADQQGRLGGLKFWKCKPTAWLPELLTIPGFIRVSSLEVTAVSHGWKGKLDPAQSFPALAMGLELWLTPRLGIREREESVLLETWLAASINKALKHVMEDKWDIPRVGRLVRESLHLDAHPQSLVPPPELRG